MESFGTAVMGGVHAVRVVGEGHRRVTTDHVCARNAREVEAKHMHAVVVQHRLQVEAESDMGTRF